METFYHWTDAVKYLHSLIIKNRPINGKGIVVEQLATGRRINVSMLPGNPGDTNKYYGAFMLVNDYEEENLRLAVVDSAHSSSSPCGIVFVGGQTIEVPLFSVEPDNESGYVILTIDYESAADDSVTYSAEITLESELPVEYDGEKWKKIVILGTYSVTTSGEGETETKSLKVSQSWCDGNVYLTDRVV